MIVCTTVNCPEGGVIQTSENYTCLFCSRIVNTPLYGEDLQIKYNSSMKTSDVLSVVKKTEGEFLAEKYCEKNHFPDSLLTDIQSLEKSLPIFSTQKNSRLRFAVSTCIILNKRDLFVDSNYIASFFRVLNSSLEKNLRFKKFCNSNNSIKSLIQIFAHNFDLDFKSGEDIYTNMMEDGTFSTGLNPIVKISVFSCIQLSTVKNISIHRASTVVCGYFHISRNTILKHVKKYKLLKSKS